jgi:hypothetical protein
MPIKVLWRGKDGTAFIALPRDKEQATARERRASLIVLKIVTGDQIGALTIETLERFKQLPQDDAAAAAPLVRVQEYNEDPLNWYTMDLVPGMTAYSLLAHYDKALPPFLMFHLFVEVYRAERFLFAHGLCHRDQSTGGNAVLRSDVEVAGGLPAVTLIDHGDIYEYTENRAYPVCRQVMGLMKTVKGEDSASVGRKWKKVGTSPEDCALMGEFLAYVEAWGDPHDLQEKDDDERKEKDRDLEVVWAKWSAAAERLRESLCSKKDLVQLQLVLQGQAMTDDDLARAIARGGVEVQVSKWE